MRPRILRLEPRRSVDWFDSLIGYFAVSPLTSFIYWRVPESLRHGLPFLGPYVSHACDALVPLLWYSVLRRRFPIGLFRWTELRAWIPFWIAAVVVMVATFGAALVLGLGPQLPSLMDVSPMGFIFTVTAPPVGEEFLWRGLIQTGLNNTLAPRLRILGLDVGVGTLITAGCFGVVHMGNAASQPYAVTCLQAASAFIGGLILGVGYERTRNLWGAITTHALADATLFACIAMLPR